MTARLYTVAYFGACLGDWLANGSELIVDPDLDIRPLDIVSLVLKPDSGRWAELLNAMGQGYAGAAKFHLGTYEANDGRVHVVGQLTPPCIALFLRAVSMPFTASSARPERFRSATTIVQPSN
jgi:hypothetical protein